MSKQKRYSVEEFTRIYDDKHGHYWQVGPDADGCDLVEIRAVEADGKESGRIVLPLGAAQKLGEAIAITVMRLHDAEDDAEDEDEL